MDQSLLPNIFNFLSCTDPFDTLSTEERDKLAGSVDIHYLMQGDRLEADRILGAGLYMVRVGAVEQRHQDDSLRARLGSGDLFGHSQMARKCECQYSVTALENTLLYLIPREVLRRLMDENPSVRDYFDGREGKRLACSNQREQAMGNDAFYLSPVGKVVNQNVAIVSPDTSIRRAAGEMLRQRRSSVLVMEGNRLLGVVTDRDMTKRVVAVGCDTERPVSEIMTGTPVTIDCEAPLIQAVELMMEHNVRSLPVFSEDKVAGVMTATSLIQRSRVQAVYLINRIYRKNSVEALKELTLQRQSVFETLVETGIHTRSIQQMMTLIANAFSKRLLQLAERTLGEPPCEYAWIVAGSQARNEVHCFSDQDNGIVLAEELDEKQKDYFRRLAEFVCYGLSECGYKLCPAHKMATNPGWCVPLDKWMDYYRSWIVRPEAEALLNVNVFLDLRFLYGCETLVTSLQEGVSEYTRNNRRFLAILTANSLRVNPPLGMFRQFVLAKDGANRSVFNIKRQALNLLVELARIYALAANSGEIDTVGRLRSAAEARIISVESCKELLEALDFINQVRFSHQRTALIRGTDANNDLEPALLSQFERNHLKDSFRIIARTQEAALQRFNAKGVLA